MDKIQKDTFIKGKDSGYHSINAVSFSQLKDLAKSTKHWETAKGLKKDTDALRLGRCFHSMALQPESFKDNLKLIPEYNPRTNEGKKIREDFDKGLLADDLVMYKPELEDGKKMMEVLKSKKSFDLVRNAIKIEEYAITDVNLADILGIDEDIFITCKFKPDFITEDGIIGDYKTMQNASLSSASYEIFVNRKYHAQMAWYSYLYSNITKDPLKSNAIIIAQEKSQPFEVSFILLDENHLNEGFDYCKKALWNYYNFLKTNKITGYVDELQLAIFK